MSLTRSISIPVGGGYGAVVGRAETVADETVTLCEIGLGASERSALIEGTVLAGGDVAKVSGIAMVNPDDGVLHLEAVNSGPVSLVAFGNGVRLVVTGDPAGPVTWMGHLAASAVYDYAFA